MLTYIHIWSCAHLPGGAQQTIYTVHIVSTIFTGLQLYCLWLAAICAVVDLANLARADLCLCAINSNLAYAATKS